MAKVLVFQHVPYEPLGLLDPMLKAHRHRIRYVNFGRPDAQIPELDDYDALIVLGGPQNIGEEAKYPHLEQEKRAISEALDMGIPILGICLGAQLLANTLGADVYPAPAKEIGWCDVELTSEGQDDPLVGHFNHREEVFQWHSYTFDLPSGATRLLTGDVCQNQAFRYGDNAYGFQCHLEVCDGLQERWLSVPQHLDDLKSLVNETANDPLAVAEHIRRNSEKTALRSRHIANEMFEAFLGLLPKVKRQYRLLSK